MVYLGLDRRLGLADWSWSCEDLLVLPYVLVLIPGSTMMFLVLERIGIKRIPWICGVILCPIWACLRQESLRASLPHVMWSKNT